MVLTERQRPTEPITSLIDGITRENIQRRFEGFIHKIFIEYLDWLEGLTDTELDRIRDGDRALITQIIYHFCMFEDNPNEDDELDINVGDCLTELMGDHNPLEFIDDNVIDDVVRLFITTTQSSILDRRLTYTDTDKHETFIRYISSIMYWMGTVWLLEWTRNELQRRMTQNHTDTMGEDDAEEGEIIIYADDRFTEHMNELHNGTPHNHRN